MSELRERDAWLRRSGRRCFWHGFRHPFMGREAVKRDVQRIMREELDKAAARGEIRLVGSWERSPDHKEENDG